MEMIFEVEVLQLGVCLRSLPGLGDPVATIEMLQDVICVTNSPCVQVYDQLSRLLKRRGWRTQHGHELPMQINLKIAS